MFATLCTCNFNYMVIKYNAFNDKGYYHTYLKDNKLTNWEININKKKKLCLFKG